MSATTTKTNETARSTTTTIIYVPTRGRNFYTNITLKNCNRAKRHSDDDDELRCKRPEKEVKKYSFI